MESHANGKQPLAAELPQPPPSSSPPKPRVSFSPDVAVVDGGAEDENGGSCSTKASPRQSNGEGGRSPRRGGASEASRPQAGLGIGDFAVMGKLGEGGYGTVHSYRVRVRVRVRVRFRVRARARARTGAGRCTPIGLGLG